MRHNKKSYKSRTKYGNKKRKGQPGKRDRYSIGGAIGTGVGALAGTIIAPGVGTNVGATIGGAAGTTVDHLIARNKSDGSQQFIQEDPLVRTPQRREQWIYKKGGAVKKYQEGGRIGQGGRKINVESRELEVNPRTGEVVRDFKEKPPHPEKGMDPEGNVIAQEGNIIIPSELREAYMKADEDKRQQIIEAVVQRRLKQEGVAPEGQQAPPPAEPQPGIMPQAQPGQQMAVPMEAAAQQPLQTPEGQPVMYKKGGKVYKYQEGGGVTLPTHNVDAQRTRISPIPLQSPSRDIPEPTPPQKKEVPPVQMVSQSGSGEVQPAEAQGGRDMRGMAADIGRWAPVAYNLARGMRDPQPGERVRIDQQHLRDFPTDVPTRHPRQEARRARRASHRAIDQYAGRPQVALAHHRGADSRFIRQTEAIDHDRRNRIANLDAQRSQMGQQLAQAQSGLDQEFEQRKLQERAARDQHIGQAAQDASRILQQADREGRMDQRSVLQLHAAMRMMRPDERMRYMEYLKERFPDTYRQLISE